MSEVKRTTGDVTCTKVFTSTFQKAGTLTAELRQEVTTTYPSINIGSDNLFAESDFNTEAGESYTSTRVCWMTVPQGVTPEDVQKKLDANPDACIYQIVSRQPILSSEQQYAIGEGLTDLATIAKSQLVRNANGEQVLKNGKVFYKKNIFSITDRQDRKLSDDDLPF